jgi:hypothetical protein
MYTVAPDEEVKPLCSSLEEALERIKSNPEAPAVRGSAAASGMVAAAEHAVGSGRAFLDTLAVLNALARAKAELDVAAWHSQEVVAVTSAILSAAQNYVDKDAIPCTEWPMPAEVSSLVAREARRYVSVRI